MKKILLFVGVSLLAYIALAQTNLTATDTVVEAQAVEETVEQSYSEKDVGRLKMSQALKAELLDTFVASEFASETKQSLTKDIIVGTNLLFLGVGVFAVILAFVLRFIISSIMSAYWKTAKNKQKMLNIGAYLHDLVKPVNAFVLLGGISVFCYLNIANEIAMIVVSRLLAIYGLWVCLSLILSVVNTFFKLLGAKVESKKPSLFMLIPLFRSITVSLSVIIFLLLVLENFGVNVSAIIASLGIGGAALAFASKDTIANFFGSVSLIIDRPFVVGDEVIVGAWHGFIESIGLRSTKIRTLASELVVIPNSTLANEHIKNNSARTLRRVEFKVGLVYSTTQAELDAAVKAVELALNNTETVSVVTVCFDEFADSSLNIYVLYTTDVVDYAGYMKVKEIANFNVMKAVRDLGLSMAFPSRSLYLENESIKIESK